MLVTIIFEREVSVEASHPALAGHFPGDPLVPGVVLLDLVVTAARELVGWVPLVALPSVKFVAPVRPGERVRIRIEAIEALRLRFVCHCEDQLAVKGWLVFGASGADQPGGGAGRSERIKPGR